MPYNILYRTKKRSIPAQSQAGFHGEVLSAPEFPSVAEALNPGAFGFRV